MAAPTLIIADDLTGAADCAVGFVAHGAACELRLSMRPPEGGQSSNPSVSQGPAVVVLDTDSRRAPPSEADAVMRAALAHAGPGWSIFKKIDSTLRGNWAAEVAALQSTLGMALVAPAFPAMGRTVRAGRVWVDAVALADTATWQLEHAGQDDSPLAMLRAAGLRAELAPNWFDTTTEAAAGLSLAGPHSADSQPLLAPCRRAQRIAAAVAAAQQRGCQALVLDAWQAHHLTQLVQALHRHGPCFWVGSAGLAQALAAQYGADHAARNAGAGAGMEAPASLAAAEQAAALQPKARAILTVVGSMSAIAQAQVADLMRTPRCALHCVSVQQLHAFDGDAPSGPEWLAAIARSLGQGRDPVVTIANDSASDPAQGPRLAHQLALALSALLPQVAALVLTGGETARAVLQPLGIERLHLLQEIEPGVVLSRAAGAQAPYIITKAGAFGDAQSLSRAYAALRQQLEARF